MRLISVLFIVMCCALNTKAQFPVSPNAFDENNLPTGYWTILYDSNVREVHQGDSTFYYRLIRFEKGKPTGKVRDFTRNAVRVWDGYLHSINPDVKYGETNYYYENGHLQYHGFYEDGKLNGFFQEYSEQGILTGEGNMKNDSSSGKWTFYFPDGTKSYEAFRKRSLDDGPYINYYESGAVNEKGNKKNGLATGLIESFHENGILASHQYYSAGKKNGAYHHWNISGLTDGEGLYDNENKTGSWVYYSDDAVKESQGDYKDNLKVGIWREFYPNGKLKYEGPWKDGVQNGPSKYYHENESLKAEGELVGNLYSGHWLFYYSNGNVRRDAFYQKDSLQGHCVYYLENGIKKSEGEYVENKKNGKWTYYFENGTIKQTEILKNDILGGTYNAYFENGQLQTTILYENDQRQGPFVEYFQNGQLKKKGTFVDDKETGEWFWFFENGQVASHYLFRAGKFDGPWTEYFPNGKTESIGVSKNGLLEGHIVHYYANGNLKKEGNAIAGKYEGKFTVYDSATGKKSSEGKYKHDKLDGIWKFYSQDGKKNDVSYYRNGFWETYTNVTDSLAHTIKLKEYDLALREVEWLKAVIHRDWPATSRVNSQPLLQYANIAYDQSDYNKALKWFEQYLASVKKLEGDTTRNYRIALNGIAITKTAMGKIDEAIVLYDKILKITPLPDTINYVTTLTNKSLALLNSGKKDEGYAILVAKWDVFRKAHGDTSKYALEVLSAMCWFQAQWADDVSKGLELYRQYLVLLDATVDQTDERYLSALQQTARCYKQLQYPAEALETYSKLVALEDSAGLELTIPHLENVIEFARLLAESGRTDTARILYSNLIRSCEELNRKGSLLYARSLDGLALVEYYSNNDSKAADLWRKALSVIEAGGETTDFNYTGMLQGLAFALSNGGKDNKKEAERLLRRAVEITRVQLGEDHLQYQKMLGSLGNFYSGEKQFHRADSILQKTALLLEASVGKDTDHYADCLQKLGALYYNQYDYPRAIFYYQQALIFWRVHPEFNFDNYVGALNTLGKSLRFLNRFGESEKIFTEAAGVYEKAKKDKTSSYIDLMTQLGNIKFDKGLFTEAESIYLNVLARQLALTGASSEQYGSKLRVVGNYYRTTREFKKSEKYYLTAMEIFEKPEFRNSGYLATTCSQLADLYSDENQTEKADVLYKRALQLSARVYGRQSEAFGEKIRNYGIFCDLNGRSSDAFNALSTATEIAERVFGKQNQIYCSYILDLASVSLRMGKNSEAERLLIEARAITTANKESDPYGYRTALQFLGDLYTDVGQYDEALAAGIELLNFIDYSEGKHVAYARALTFLATTEFVAKLYAKADSTDHAALAILEEELDPGNPFINEIHDFLGLIALREHRLDDAEQQFKISLSNDVLNKRTKEEGYRIAINNLACVKSEKGEFAEAEKLFSQANALLKASGVKPSLENEANRLDNQAELYQAWGKYDLAEKIWKEVLADLQSWIRQNFPFMSDYEKAKFWDKNSEDFEKFNTFAMLAKARNPAISTTLYDLELATKGILLSASGKVRKRILASHDSIQIKSYFEWTQTRELLAREYTLATSSQKSKRADSLERRINQIEKELSLSAEEARPEKQLSWKDVQKSLGPDEAAVELIRFHYFNRQFTDSIIYAAVVVTAETKLNPAIAVLPAGTNLEKRAYRYYRNSIINRQDDTLSYRQFWSFVEPLVAGKTKIFIAPDGVYSQVNLKTMKNSAGSYLMDRHDFILVSSTRDVPLLKQKKKTRFLQNASLIGNPKFFIGGTNSAKGEQRSFSDEDRGTVAQLPGTEKEIAEVETLLTRGGWKVNELIEAEATEENVKKLPSSRILHLATHGFFKDSDGDSWSSKDPMLRAGILLSGASNFIQHKQENNGENGILTAYEASNLSLEGTELVVLSACETARGEMHQGEGVYGLQRAFISAGAETLVMSLWKVDDTATQKLMTLFYQNLLKGLDKNEALSNAQRELKKTYPHPYYWGAFVMMRG